MAVDKKGWRKAVSHSLWQLGFMGGLLQLFCWIEGALVTAREPSGSLTLLHSHALTLPLFLAACGAVLFTQPILGLISVVSVAFAFIQTPLNAAFTGTCSRDRRVAGCKGFGGGEIKLPGVATKLNSRGTCDLHHFGWFCRSYRSWCPNLLFKVTHIRYLH